MSDSRDYKLDLSPGAQPSTGPLPTPAPSPVGRPYVSVHFTCCNVYLRIYRSADGKSYRGGCPKCGVTVHFAVGPGGTDSRTFVVR